MKEYTFTQQEIEFLQRYRKKTKKVSVYEKITIILLLAEGRTEEETASILGVSVKTVSRCAQSYRQRGIAGLEPISKKKLRNHSHLEPEQEEELKAHVAEQLYPNAKAIRQYIYDRYGVKYSVSGVQALLKRLNFSFKKVSVAPVKADPQRQQEFIEQYHRLRQDFPEALIYFVDAVHFLHQMMASCAWMLKGTTKVLPTNSGRNRINILGAYEPRTHELIYLETLACCNSDLVTALLDKVRALHPGVKIFFILDNVRYQHAPVVKAKAAELEIELEYLPSYSPNLNLIERLWKLMKKVIVRNHYYATFAEFVAKVREFLAHYKEYEAEISRLITEHFQLVYAT